MRISDVIRRKGDMVVTVRPSESVERLLALLEEHRIGALVVSANGETVDGIVSAGGIDDYTHLWWDVRPHPNLGTVELRVFDQQTRVEHTIGFAAFAQALAHRLSAEYEERVPSIEYPLELIDDNKVRAALVGIEGELIDFDQGVEVPAEEMTLGVIEDLRENARELGCEDELSLLVDLVENGTGARRQLDWLSQHGDIGGLMSEIVTATDPDH
jgi:carboxylate-amine ligase